MCLLNYSQLQEPFLALDPQSKKKVLFVFCVLVCVSYYTSDFKTRILPLMYIFEIADVMFC